MKIIAGHNGGNCKKIKDKYIANQKIEIGETSFERPKLTTPITIEDGRPGHKRTLIQMLQKCQNGTEQIESKKKKNLKSNAFQSIL